MGSKMAPNYACLYMGVFENDFILNESNSFFPKILLYKRYIDDIFVNFTMECDPVSISFLDVSVYICDGKLHTDLYRKPTDRNTILRGDSFHPRPLIKSLPISQFKRVRRVCSTAESYSQQSTDLTKRFLNRGYRKEWIDNAKKKVNETSQIQCLRTKHTNKTQFSNAPICTIKYSALGAEFRRVLNKHWHIISSDPKLSCVFKNDPKLVFKRQSNLRVWISFT